ncbi:MAG: hypothetical protein ACKVRP_10225 [Bacteroidota bacterium]
MNRKRLSNVLLVTTLTAVLFMGCAGEKKMEPVPVGEMVAYTDPGIGFTISYPKGWVANTQVGQAVFYNAEGVEGKFRVPTDPGAMGVEVAVRVTKTADPAGAINQLKTDWSQSGVQLGQEQSLTVAGAQGTKVPFVANYGEGNIINSHHILIAGDSIMYDLGFSGFGERYNAHAAVFDAILASFQLPKPKEAGADETLPSETFTSYDAKMFAFEYPENFNFTNPAKGKNELVIGLRGVRLDCNIQFDVFGAQGLTVEKVFDQNKDKFRGATFGDAKIGGEAAKYLTYSASGVVERRIYFVVRNDKVMRATFDWFKPQRAVYLPVYERVVNSIKFK